MADYNLTNQNNFKIGEEDALAVLQTYTIYKIADAIKVYYYLFLVPLGVAGNILSFLVMIQPHNRHMSFSIYLSALAVSDTIALLIAFSRYLNLIHDIPMPPNQDWHCNLVTVILFSCQLCSTFFILIMTFERCYSIAVPHKAASFNRVQRAKVTISCIVVLMTLYNVPHLFYTTHRGRDCFSYQKGVGLVHVEIYHWLSFFLSFAMPFVFLLIMNSFIIHTLRVRSVGLDSEVQYQGFGTGRGSNHQKPKTKNYERHVCITLLSVTFTFLCLYTPIYVYRLIALVLSYYPTTPYSFAILTLFYEIAVKLMYSNYGINFFLYAISGQKFRNDLVVLFKCKKPDASNVFTARSSSISVISKEKTYTS